MTLKTNSELTEEIKAILTSEPVAICNKCNCRYLNLISMKMGDICSIPYENGICDGIVVPVVNSVKVS